MPCNTVTTTKIQWSQQTDTELLQKALIQLGYTANRSEYGNIAAWRGLANINYNGQTHTMTTNSSADVVALIKQAYSAQIVKAAAGRFGWQLQETQPGRQFQAARRF